MKVLVIGKGGREHSLCWRLNQSPSVWGLYCSNGGSPGINTIAEPVAIDANDVAGLADFVQSKSIDLTVVGPEDPLATGIVDEFRRRALPIFGPTKAAAQLEVSKSFAKQVMLEAGVPTADARIFDDPEAARQYVRSQKTPMVVKADGLALGKGVTVCDDPQSALSAVEAAMDRRAFGAAGARVLIEERLFGQEVSFFAISDGERAVAFGLAQDHKPVLDGDRGPNTGGMGAYSPTPQFSAEFEARVMSQVVEPTLKAMAARGTPYTGVLYVGLMVDEAEQFKVIEFNARFGDPECEPLMMRVDGDFAAMLLAAAKGKLDMSQIRISPRSAVAVVLASGGYPGAYKKGVPISGLERIEGGEPSDAKVRWSSEQIRVKVFQAGTAMKNGVLVTDSGRVLVVTAMAETLERARSAAYEAAAMIDFEGKHLRHDIGSKALARAEK